MAWSKNPGPAGPGFGYPQRGFALLEFIALLKFQISNPKYQTNSNDQNSKFKTDRMTARHPISD